MPLKNYYRRLQRQKAPLYLAILVALPISAQTPQLTIVPPDQVMVKRGGETTVRVQASLSEGFHLNSHTPQESYLIPLSLKWMPGALDPGEIVYPPPKMLKVPFDEKPLSVLTGKFEITTKFKAAPTAVPGPSSMSGKLRYQACNDKSCFPPKTLDVKIPVEIQ